MGNDFREAPLLDEINRLRHLLFHMHPCQGKYGDDGEMQCGCGIDFKRDPIHIIEEKTFIRDQKALYLNNQNKANNPNP